MNHVNSGASLIHEIHNTYASIPYAFGDFCMSYVADLIGSSYEQVDIENRRRGGDYIDATVAKFKAHDYSPPPSRQEYTDYPFFQQIIAMKNSWKDGDRRQFLNHMFELKRQDREIIASHSDKQLLTSSRKLNRAAAELLGYCDIRKLDADRTSFMLKDPSTPLIGEFQLIGETGRYPIDWFYFTGLWHRDASIAGERGTRIEMMLGYLDFSMFYNATTLYSKQGYAEWLRHPRLLPKSERDAPWVHEFVETKNCSIIAAMSVFKELWLGMNRLVDA